jgi:hypothetical protein
MWGWETIRECRGCPSPAAKDPHTAVTAFCNGLVRLRANIFGMTMTDTSPAARARQDEILRAMTGEQRMTLAYEMSMFARELAREGIRRDHPDWSDAQIARELLRLAFLPAPLPAWLERALGTYS